ncbi:MAG TPA: tetratricopeptide repeat protein [Vicinamibacterales bacterium]
MPIDRAEALKKAEKLLRQGKLDGAIGEYLRIIEEQPRDWNSRNALGDLQVRAGQLDKAAAQYGAIAEHLMHEGFFPRAAALFKKILKIKPDDEAVQLNLAEISTKQGLLADAKGYFTAVANKRRARGDRAGSDEIIVRLGSIDPSDFDARVMAARTLAQNGDEIAAAIQYRSMHADLLDKGRAAEAFAALREAVRYNHEDVDGRAELAKAAVAAGDLDTARTYLNRGIAGDDPSLLMALMEIELRAGNMESGREILKDLLHRDAELRTRIVELAWTLAPASSQGAFVCIDVAVEAELAAGNYMDAAAILQEFATRVPGQIDSLLKLVEICVDGGLEALMYETQAQLADAYLEAGQGTEARVISEDLVAREPWEHAHIERFRRALLMLNVPDPDTIIADRLSGQGPFVATDPFMAPDSFGEPEPALLHPNPPGELGAEPPPAAVDGPPVLEPAVPPANVDLTNLLGELEGITGTAKPAAPPQNLEAVFENVRAGVSKQSGGTEASQHLALARTYLDMGMEEEAIAALRTAARSPSHRFEAASLLGRLYLKRGDLPHAIEWLERAAEAPAPDQKEARELLYDLGRILEAAGETARALAVFLELQADAGEYRDVAMRVSRLSRVETGG